MYSMYCIYIRNVPVLLAFSFNWKFKPLLIAPHVTQGDNSLSATNNSCLIHVVRFPTLITSTPTYWQSSISKASVVAQKKNLYKLQSGRGRKRKRVGKGEGAECGTDTSRKLYLHHLHMKLVCTTATAGQQAAGSRTSGLAAWGRGWGQLGAAIGIWLAYRGCRPHWLI